MNKEISIVDVASQLVLGMTKRGPYKNIAVMIPQLCLFAAQNGIQMIGPPIYICHEPSVEEAEKPNKENNANVEVTVPIAQRAKKQKK
jgi:effector-binding domain-containing protein